MPFDTENVTPDGKPASAVEVSRNYGFSIIFLRWAGAWIDFFVLLLFLCIPDFLLGNAIYQMTIFIWLGLVIAYFPVMETLCGKTVGKFVTQTRVVNAKGEHPSWKQSIIRTLLRLVEGNPLLVGGIPAGIAMAASKNRQRIGDMAAGTYVLQDKDAARIPRS
jgi:uncharacterized RDD family membrane protein YckC